MTMYLKCSCMHCGGHIEYPAEAAGNSATCPHCGADTELTVPLPPEMEEEPPRRPWLLWVLFAFLILGIAGALAPVILKRALARKQAKASAPKPGPGGPGFVQISEFAVAPVKVTKAPDGSLIHASGMLSNMLGNHRYGIRVDLETIDATGTTVGAATDYTAIIEGNGTWNYRALVLNANAVTARVTRIREQRATR